MPRTLTIEQIKKKLIHAHREGQFPCLSGNLALTTKYVGSEGTACAVGVFLSKSLRDKLLVYATSYSGIQQTRFMNSESVSSFASIDIMKLRLPSLLDFTLKEMVEGFGKGLPYVEGQVRFAFWQGVQDENDRLVCKLLVQPGSLTYRRKEMLDQMLLFLDTRLALF